MAYVDDGVLALDGDAEVAAGELHVQVAALVFAVDGDGHVQVLDGLGPLVGQGGLLGVLPGLGLGIEPLLLVGGGFSHLSPELWWACGGGASRNARATWGRVRRGGPSLVVIP